MNYKKIAGFYLAFFVAMAVIGTIDLRNKPQPADNIPFDLRNTRVERKPNITCAVPTRELTYPQIISQLQQWNLEAPDQTEIGNLGKIGQNKYPTVFLRLGKRGAPKVLIMAAIHGNEKLGTMVAMGCIGTMLKEYMSDPNITKLLTSRNIYFIPVVCPEAYDLNQRYESGKDPNRNWLDNNAQEIQSIPSIELVKKFHKKTKFNAMMSCHNHGGIYLYPWGCTRSPTKSEVFYRSMLAQMSQLSSYRFLQLVSGNHAPPHYGYEIDWFYKNGATSLVVEIGSSFRANPREITYEVNRNLGPMLIFIKRAPLARQ